jgi:membrane protein DedA with SNARE-associated domain
MMPTFLLPLTTWTSNALSGMADPWVIVAALALTTLLLEDVAIAAGVAVATQGALSWEWAFVAVAGGIALGDLGLYGLGVGANRIPLLRRKYIEGRESRARDLLASRLASAVLIARVVPGLRLVTYTACGFWRTPMAPFTAWVVLAVALWTAGLFWLSSALGGVIAETLHIPAPLAVALPVIALALAFPLWRWLRRNPLLK